MDVIAFFVHRDKAICGLHSFSPLPVCIRKVSCMRVCVCLAVHAYLCVCLQHGGIDTKATEWLQHRWLCTLICETISAYCGTPLFITNPIAISLILGTQIRPVLRYRSAPSNNDAVLCCSTLSINRRWWKHHLHVKYNKKKSETIWDFLYFPFCLLIYCFPATLCLHVHFWFLLFWGKGMRKTLTGNLYNLTLKPERERVRE